MSESKRHPNGLYLLFATEMWERFSYYGMRAILALYLTVALASEFTKESAAQLYGSFTGLVYLTPLLGGYIADRYWGNRRSIFWGGLMMALGQLFMFFSACFYTDIVFAKFFLYLGLVLLILGNGFFKPNISTMVGDLYEPTDKRKDSAFTIFYMGINIGACISPIICGWLGERSMVDSLGNVVSDPTAFKWGFLAACIGMVISVTVFEILKNRFLVTPDGKQIGMPKKVDYVHHEQMDINLNVQVKQSPLRLVLSVIGVIVFTLLFSCNFEAFPNSELSIFEGADWIGSAIFAISIVIPIFIYTDSLLTALERSRIIVIYIIAFFVIFFWAAFEQAGASLTFFAKEQTDRVVLGFEVPASWLQSVNAFFVVALAPIFAGIWSYLGKKGKEPSSPSKQALGLFFLSMGYLVIAIGVRNIAPGEKSSILWIISLYLLHTMGELSLSPIGLSLVSKLSPARLASLLMGVWFLSTAAANKFAGILGGYYPEGGVAKSFLGYSIENMYDFFMLFVVMAGVAAVILFLLTGYLKKLMHGIE